MKIHQLEHHELQTGTHSLELIIVACNIESPANAGAILRLADAFNVTTVYFCGNPVNLDSNRLKRTSRSAEKTVRIKQSSQILTQLKALKDQNYYLVGLEVTSNSIALYQHKLMYKRIALVVGNEKNGIPDHVLQELDNTVHIPMFGKNTSMNLSHAAAIALYELTKPEL